jgi:hypothetical protein
MSERQFANFSIETLEKLFDESRKQLNVLQSIAAELVQHRKTSRAKKLLERVVQAIGIFESIELSEDDEPWSSYERKLTDAERAHILRCPAGQLSSNMASMPLWEQGAELARVSEHILVPHIRKTIEERGIALIHNFEGYGLASRLACFEVRVGPVKSWHSFALLFRKLLGEKAVPWLPMLYLSAIAAPDISPAPNDFDEVLAFRDQMAKL